MTKQEFFDKIDNVRILLNGIANPNDPIKESIALLDQLGEDAELLLEEEYEAGYELGLNRSENLAGE